MDEAGNVNHEALMHHVYEGGYTSFLGRTHGEAKRDAVRAGWQIIKEPSKGEGGGHVAYCPKHRR